MFDDNGLSTDNGFLNTLGLDEQPGLLANLATPGEQPPSMFPILESMGLDGEPTAEDIERQAEAVRHEKHVMIEDICVRTFRFDDPDQVAQYTELYKELYNGVKRSLIHIKHIEKTYVDHPGTVPYYLMHIEWWVYSMTKKDHADPTAPVQEIRLPGPKVPAAPQPQVVAPVDTSSIVPVPVAQSSMPSYIDDNDFNSE
jgi:hypothetical protein